MMLSIDPGIRGVGAALWDGRALVRAEYVKNPFVIGNGPRESAAVAYAVHAWAMRNKVVGVTKIVLEYPQIYQREGGKTKGDPNHLLCLAAIDGAIAAVFTHADIEYFRPADWKGNTCKPENDEEYVITGRVKGRLDALECESVVWPTSKKLTYDVADAIGVGLHSLGRFERKRVYARE